MRSKRLRVEENVARKKRSVFRDNKRTWLTIAVAVVRYAPDNGEFGKW